MRDRSELLAILATVEQLTGWSLLVIAAAAALIASFILLFRVPARATVIEDGYRRAWRERNAAVFLRERAPMPLFVQDHVRFRTRDGEEFRVTLTRTTYRSAPPAVVWYSPSDPRRVTGTSPIRCLALCLASLGTFAWFFWW